ncbi:MAG TPA: TIGR02996 domain-containing protein [Kofleriaceae bacterium]
MATNPELEALIDAAPDDKANYAVYGDWLQANGDVRGELIALQLAGKDGKRLIAANAEHFYGQLAPFIDMLEQSKYADLGPTTSWRWGFLDTLWLGQKRDHSRTFKGKAPVDLNQAFGWIIDHPSARFVRTVTVGIENYEDNSYEAVARAIAVRPRPTLTTLVLGDFYSEETELNWSNLGDVSPIWAAAPNLERITLRSGTIATGALELAKLRELHIISGGLDRETFDHILAAALPNLERLTLQLGEDLEFEVGELAPILDATRFPKLVHLGLGNSPKGDEICAAIASSRITAQLESLDMALGTMGDAGATALAAGTFPRLKSIDVGKCFLSEAGIAALSKLTALVGDDDQNDEEPDDRYISGRE